MAPKQGERHMIGVTLVFSPAQREVVQASVALPEGSTVLQALLAVGWRERFHLDQLEDMGLGIWNRGVTLKTMLKDQDRVEVYRPLKVDPKRARRERFSNQGAKTPGLFARRRAGAKPGY
jgi:putative ubiquitin-RnfH superfamily antitoxin RatB of RatAB toxin-antitoxin module